MELKDTEFSIVYGGDAYSDNQIDAKTLGDALQSLSSLIEHSDKLLNNEKANPRIIIKAHKEGSFEIICSALGVSLNTLEALGFTVASGAVTGTVWGVLEKLKGKEIAEINFDEKTNTTKLVVDNDEIECTEEVSKLLISPQIREHIDSLVCKPLNTEKESFFKLKSGQQDLIEIQQDSIKIFSKENIIKKSITKNEEKIDEINVNFSKVNFTSKKGWCIILSDKKTLNVSMNDNDFLERVNANETKFSKDDLFVVSLKKTTNLENNEIKKETYSIEKVIRHRVAEEKKII